MRARAKVHLVLGTFCGILFSFLAVLTVSPSCCLAKLSSLCQSIPGNCIFVAFSSLFAAWVLSEFAALCHTKFQELKSRKTKLGKILLSQGYVTQDELREALNEQSLKIGEVLVRAGRVSSGQLQRALNHQKQFPGRLGEILREMGFSSDDDIEWALSNRRRKVGEILLKNGIITKYDLNSSLALKRFGPKWVEKAWKGRITIH
jgi:hypothetical protein